MHKDRRRVPDLGPYGEFRVLPAFDKERFSLVDGLEQLLELFWVRGIETVTGIQCIHLLPERLASFAAET
jgi:hypothetical protein